MAYQDSSLTPYRGSEPYIFISYSHRNSDRASAIIRSLDLRRPVYRQTAAYGHFGRTDVDLTWEHEDRVDALRAAAGLA